MSYPCRKRGLHRRNLALALRDSWSVGFQTSCFLAITFFHLTNVWASASFGMDHPGDGVVFGLSGSALLLHHTFFAHMRQIELFHQTFSLRTATVFRFFCIHPRWRLPTQAIAPKTNHLHVSTCLWSTWLVCHRVSFVSAAACASVSWPSFYSCVEAALIRSSE